VLVVALLLGGRGVARAQQAAAGDEWSAAGRTHAYAHDLFGPSALLGTLAASTVDQLRTDPDQWGDGAGGFGRRVASNAGNLAVNQTVRHGLALAMGRSTRYQPCGCSGVGARIGHALLETATDRDRAGGRMLSVPRFAGAFAGAFAQRIWRPGMSAGTAAGAGAGELVLGALSNVALELVGWPR
jgi:hypothetical protein